MNLVVDLPGSAEEKKKKKRDEITNNKYLNVWQKKHLLDEMDAAESKPAAKAPQQPPKQLVAEVKPKIVRPANPFTYLNGPTGPDKGRGPETAAGGSGRGGTPPVVPGPSTPPAPMQTPAPPAVTKPEPPPRPNATPAPAPSQPKAGNPTEGPKPPILQANPYQSRKQSILNDKTLNAHQKRYLLDELEAKYGNGSAAAPALAPTVTVPYGLNGSDRQKAQDIAANDSIPDSQKKALMGHYEQKAKETLKYSRYNQLLQGIVNDDSLTPDQKKKQAGELKNRLYSGVSKEITAHKQEIEPGKDEDERIVKWIYSPPGTTILPNLPRLSTETSDEIVSKVPLSKQQYFKDYYSVAGNAGIHDAKQFLDKVLEHGYSSYTPVHRLENEREDYINREEFIKTISHIPDLGLAVSSGFSEATEDFGPEGLRALPGFWIGDGVLRSIGNMISPGPSISEGLNAGRENAINAELAKYKNKIDYTNGTDYKYLVQGPNDIYGKSIRSEKWNYIDRIEGEMKDVLDKLPDYGSEEENEQYKEAYVSYLKKILKMNMEQGKNYSEWKRALKDLQ